VMNKRGFVLIETAAAMGIAVSILITLLSLLYLGIAKIYLNRAVYETAICAVSRSTVSNCETSFYRQMKGLPWTDIKNFDVKKYPGSVRVNARLQVFGKIHISDQQTVLLPLVSAIPAAANESLQAFVQGSGGSSGQVPGQLPLQANVHSSGQALGQPPSRTYLGDDQHWPAISRDK
jgi:hypothetical protein